MLSRLIALEENYSITCLTRSEEKAKLIDQLRPNLTAIQGDLSNESLLEEQASKHDISINTADADHVGRDKPRILNLSAHAALSSAWVHPGHSPRPGKAQGCYRSPAHPDPHFWNWCAYRRKLEAPMRQGGRG